MSVRPLDAGRPPIQEAVITESRERRRGEHLPEPRAGVLGERQAGDRRDIPSPAEEREQLHPDEQREHDVDGREQRDPVGRTESASFDGLRGSAEPDRDRGSDSERREPRGAASHDHDVPRDLAERKLFERGPQELREDRVRRCEQDGEGDADGERDQQRAWEDQLDADRGPASRVGEAGTLRQPGSCRPSEGAGDVGAHARPHDVSLAGECAREGEQADPD